MVMDMRQSAALRYSDKGSPSNLWAILECAGLEHIEVMMKRVLFVSYNYPPGPRVGCERVLKFRKHLPTFGYETYVLTARVWGTQENDQESGVCRPYEPFLIYRALLRRLLGPRPTATQQFPVMSMSEGTRLQPLRDWGTEWVLIPDLQIAWLPWAVLAGWRLIREKRIDVIVSTSGPETDHLVGACLSSLTGLPHVADFRDGWLFEPLKPFLRRSRFRRSIDGCLERRIVQHAVAVTSVSESLTEYFHQSYGLPAQRAVTITNGYDIDDWQGVVPGNHEDGRLRIVHTGAFAGSSPTRNPRPFFESVARLPVDIRGQVEILLVGQVTEDERRMIEALGLRDSVRVIPPVPRAESLAYQLSADVLLLLVGSDRSVATSKLYEYLYARRPILAIGSPETAAAKIVQQTHSGLVIDPRDPDAILRALSQLHEAWRKQQLRPFAQGDISRYERRNLARELAAVLDRVTGKRS
jgi:glycosyltransferase involved in cell wall biosynthesis